MGDKSPQPAIILVRPQLGENIGKAARAMLNFGLTDLRLVAPRDGWPNPDAGPSAAGADVVLDQARVFNSVEDAVADCNLVYATTRRERDMMKTVVTPDFAVKEGHALALHDKRLGILFGPERSGLNNDDIALSDAILMVPLNQEFGSLNLAQAVVIFAYEWFKAKDETEGYRLERAESDQASKEDLQGLIDHLEDALKTRGYFRPEAREPALRRTLRNLLQRPGFTAQEVQTLRGVIKRLDKFDREGKKRPE